MTDIKIISRFLTGELDDVESKELLNWVEASEANRQFFTEIKNQWVLSADPGNMEEVDIANEYNKFLAKINDSTNFTADIANKKNNTLPLLLKIAASVILVYSLGISLLYLNRHKEDGYNEITTRKGEKSQLTLSDGTTIWINSGSTLRYPVQITDSKVQVYLKGEAYFDVASVKGREFIVNSGDMHISVLGTSFNVKAYEEEGIVEAILEEGKISITGKIGSEILKDPVVLMPNQKIVIQQPKTSQNKPIVIEKVTATIEELPANENASKPESVNADIIIEDHTNTELYTSWKDGQLKFNKETFDELAKKMERWYDVQITINDAEMKNWYFTGTFDKETVEQALYALSLSVPFSFKIDKNNITIGRKTNY